MNKNMDAVRRREPLAAGLIGAAALLEVILITHHPIAHAGTHGAPLESIRAVAQVNLGFHTLMIVILVGQLVGLALFARALGLHRPMVIAGLILCAIASFMLLVAMTFDGFVTYELIGSCSPAAQDCAASGVGSLGLVLAIISAFTKLGFGAQCLGFASLSGALWPGQRVTLVAIAGVILALAPIAVILASGRAQPSSLFHILAFLAVWGLCMAAVLARGLVVHDCATRPRA